VALPQVLKMSLTGSWLAATGVLTLVALGAGTAVAQKNETSAQSYYEQRLEMLAAHPLSKAPALVDLAIVNVNVMPMTEQRVVRDQVVLIRDGRIASIGSAGDVNLPKNVRVIDGRGGYLMPGLADMHVHSNGNPLSLSLLLANGITTIRQMSGRPEYIEWARQIADGRVLGPAIYTTGPILGGRKTSKDTVVASEQDARSLVEAQYASGYRLLKPYTFLSAPAYRAAMQTAKAKGMYVVGHIPYSVGTAGILDAGQDEVAHVHSFHQDYFRDFDPAKVFENYAVDDSFIARVVPRLRDAGIAVTTTLVVDQALADAQNIERYLSRPEMNYETPGAAAFMRSADWTFDKLWPHDYLESVYLPYLYRLTRALQEAGVPLVLGTDSGATGVVYGFSVHEELDLLVRAGLTPFQALLAGTRNAAAAARSSDEWGTVEVGKRADLLLLRANPLEDITRTRDIDGVMRAGHWLDRQELDRQLAQVRAAYR
jgi:imidazolonepropionase-like amidohydrolase